MSLAAARCSAAFAEDFPEGLAKGLQEGLQEAVRIRIGFDRKNSICIYIYIYICDHFHNLIVYIEYLTFYVIGIFMHIFI